MDDEGDTPRSSPAVTVAATATLMTPEPAVALAVPIQKPKAAATPDGGGAGRDDGWSEGATEVLIDAWGERFLELSRGNLRQKDWQEVADVVSSRGNYTKQPKSDTQCKNRIDTLKKKYKLEKTKIAAASSPSNSSSWPFFSRLDDLIGRNPLDKESAPDTEPPADEALHPKSNLQVPQLCKKKRSTKKSHRQLLQKLPVLKRESSSSSGSLPPGPETIGKRKQFTRETNNGVRAGVFSEKGLMETTRAIVKFGEVYERVERSKMRQAVEMEKQRMAFAKELELQRMQFFMKIQLELTQLKRDERDKVEEGGDCGDGGGGLDGYDNSNDGDGERQITAT